MVAGMNVVPISAAGTRGVNNCERIEQAKVCAEAGDAGRAAAARPVKAVAGANARARTACHNARTGCRRLMPTPRGDAVMPTPKTYPIGEDLSGTDLSLLKAFKNLFVLEL